MNGQSTVVYVYAPTRRHAANIIGKEGAHIDWIQNKYHVVIIAPGDSPFATEWKFAVDGARAAEAVNYMKKKFIQHTRQEMAKEQEDADWLNGPGFDQSLFGNNQQQQQQAVGQPPNMASAGQDTARQSNMHGQHYGEPHQARPFGGNRG